jgi:phosphoribosyl 1,2-cyclic phosphate phosphodiesterase
MKLLFLGTGTSVGVPMIGCGCAVCRSTDPRNRRRRTSLYLRAGGQHVIVDTTPDFREQALAYSVPRVDAILFTHSHADHIFGLDDVRRFNTIQDQVIPAYAHGSSLADLRRVFDYIGVEKVHGHYRPQIEFRTITGTFELGGLRVTPLPVIHDEKPTLGFLFEEHGCRVGYVPDCLEMDPVTVERLQGADVMVLDALRRHPHRTHLTLDQSVALLQRIKARQSFLIHMCHDLDHAQTEATLPEGIRMSYDGMTLELPGPAER